MCNQLYFAAIKDAPHLVNYRLNTKPLYQHKDLVLIGLKSLAQYLLFLTWVWSTQLSYLGL